MTWDRKVWHQCDGCGLRKKLSRLQRHWCPCADPRFRMVWDAHRKLARKERRA